MVVLPVWTVCGRLTVGSLDASGARGGQQSRSPSLPNEISCLLAPSREWKGSSIYQEESPAGLSGGPSPSLLVGLAARRLVLGVDVAAAKFASGQRIDDPAREREILRWAAERLAGAGTGRLLGVAFFRDQIAASKVIQRGLHTRWRDHPQEAPPRWRDLTTEIRPELDVISEDMLSLLAGLVDMRPLPPGRCAVLFDQGVSASPVLGALSGLRHAAARVALRSLSTAGGPCEVLQSGVG
jgi:chorismate mutase